MGEGDEDKGDLPKLRKREDFHGWKEKMLLYSIEKVARLTGRCKNRSTGSKQEGICDR